MLKRIKVFNSNAKNNSKTSKSVSPTPADLESLPHPYLGRVAALATKHDKLPLIAPPLETAVGLHIEAIEVNTDSLGTFTGEVPRTAPPLETAIAKARLGMKVADMPLGIASEGSIGPDPMMPLVTSDREIVVLVDDESKVVIWESYTSWDIIAATTTVRAGDDMQPFLVKAQFPNHKLIVRPNTVESHPIYKGIDNVEELIEAVVKCATASVDGLARIETDLRAHVCPSRRVVIATAAERLANRVAARCPSCGAPGWGQVNVVLGIPCRECGTEVAQPRAMIDGCLACDHRINRPLILPETQADPKECPYCNP